MGLVNLYIKNTSGQSIDAFDNVQWPYFDVDAVEALDSDGKFKQNQVIDLYSINSKNTVSGSIVLAELIQAELIKVIDVDKVTELSITDGLKRIQFIRPADVVDDLSSNDVSLPLSANQGKLLHLRILALENQETYVETGLQGGGNYMIQKNQNTFILQGAPSSAATMRLPNAQGNTQMLGVSDAGWYVTVINTNEFTGVIYLQYGGGFDYYTVQPDSFIRVTWNGSSYDVTQSGINARSLNFQTLEERFAPKQIDFTNELSVIVTHDKGYIPLTEVWVEDGNQVLVRADVHISHDWVNKNSFEVVFGALSTGKILYR